MVHTHARLIFLSFFLSAFAAGFYDGDKDIVPFNEPNDFVEKVLGSSHIWVVEFYAPWCGHCKNFAPEFKKAAENLRNIIHFGAVDCNEEKSKPLCGHFQVKGLPTVLLFKSDLEQIKEDGKTGFTKKPVAYEGARKAAPLANWALTFLPEKTTKITAKNIESFLNPNVPAFSKVENFALFFTNKEKTSNVLKSLQLEFALTQQSKEWLPIGVVSHTEADLVTKYEITNFPSLVIVNKKGEVQQKFSESEFSFENMGKFLRNFAYKPNPEDFQGKPPAPAPPPPPKKNELHLVNNQADYDSYCSKFGLCFIAFLDTTDPDHNKYIELLTNLVTKFKSLNVVWINGPEHTEFSGKFPIADGFPQAVIFHRRKLKIRVMKNAWEEDLVHEFVDNTLSGKGRTMGMDEDPKFGEKSAEKPAAEKSEL